MIEVKAYLRILITPLAIFLLEKAFSETNDFLYIRRSESFMQMEIGSLIFYSLWTITILVCLVLIPPFRRIPFKIEMESKIDGAIAVAICLMMIVPKVIYILKGDFSFPRFNLPFISGAILAPIVEEWLFRGILWDAIPPGKSIKNLIMAILVTSICFGLWHLPFHNNSIMPHIVYGFMLSILRWKTNSISPGIIVHIFGNALFFI